MLKTVIINGKKPEENLNYNLVSEQFADQVIHADQMAKGGPFSVRIEGVLHGVHILRGGVDQAHTLIATGSSAKPMQC